LCYAKSECPIGLSSLRQESNSGCYNKNLDWRINEVLLNNTQPINKLYSIDQSLYYRR
jgi:hypothetical protein